MSNVSPVIKFVRLHVCVVFDHRLSHAYYTLHVKLNAKFRPKLESHWVDSYFYGECYTIGNKKDLVGSFSGHSHFSFHKTHNKDETHQFQWLPLHPDPIHGSADSTEFQHIKLIFNVDENPLYTGEGASVRPFTASRVRYGKLACGRKAIVCWTTITGQTDNRGWTGHRGYLIKSQHSMGKSQI